VRFTKGAGVRRKTPALTVGSLIAVSAMLVVAAPAMGSADPLKGGTTTLNLSSLKVSKAMGGATKAGKKSATLQITGGSLDPTNGTGPVKNGGSLKLKMGSSSATLSEIVTGFGGSLSAKLKGKTVNLATLSGGTAGRAGFGGTVTGATAKLTKKGAKALNKAFGTSSFKKGKKLGTADTSTVPSTVGVKSATSSTTEDITGLPACAATATCTTYAGKLAEDGITSTPTNGANITGPAPPIVVTFQPQTGGSMAPDCKGGTLTGSVGTITLSRGAVTLAQANPNDEFGNQAVSFEATASGLGFLGRAPATNLVVTPGTCVANAATKTITVTATQTVNAAAATVANNLFGLNGTACPSGTGPPQNCPIAGGTVIGTSTYSITTQ
jgi:hypothetical protein